MGPVDKAMLTQTCTRRVHSSSEESAAWTIDQRSVVEADRLLVLLFLWRRRVIIETTTTPHQHASHSLAIAAPLLACITAHST